MYLSSKQVANSIAAVSFAIVVIAVLYGIASRVRFALKHLEDAALIRRELESLKMVSYMGMSSALALGVLIARLVHR